MKKNIFIRSLIVSIIIAVITPCITMSIYVPEEGANIPDFNSIDETKLDGMTTIQKNEYIKNNIKMKEVTGIERFTHIFSLPNILTFYWRAAFMMFIPIFISTFFCSFLTIKSLKNRKI